MWSPVSRRNTDTLLKCIRRSREAGKEREREREQGRWRKLKKKKTRTNSTVVPGKLITRRLHSLKMGNHNNSAEEVN